MGALIENPRHTAERLLTSRVPNLQLDYLIVDFNGECTELHSNRHLMFQLKLLVHDSGKEATFAYTRITNNDLFKEVILSRQLLVMDHLIWD